MRKFKFNGLLFVLFLFCGTIANSKEVVRYQDIDLVFIGNSITYGAFLTKPEAPPANAAIYLRQQPGMKSVKFINRGISGFTTVDFLPSRGKTFNDLVQATQQFHKDHNRMLIFSISLGTNDSAEFGTTGAPVSREDYKENLKSIVDQLKKDFPGCKVIFQQPTWYSPNTYNSSKYMSEGLARLQSYFPELKSLVADYAISDPGFAFLGDLDGFGYFEKNYLTDLTPEHGHEGVFYLHPNKKGAVVLGHLWAKAIYQEILKNK